MTNDEYIKIVKRNSNRIYLIALSYLQNHHDAEEAIKSNPNLPKMLVVKMNFGL